MLTQIGGEPPRRRDETDPQQSACRVEILLRRCLQTTFTVLDENGGLFIDGQPPAEHCDQGARGCGTPCLLFIRSSWACDHLVFVVSLAEHLRHGIHQAGEKRVWIFFMLLQRFGVIPPQNVVIGRVSCFLRLCTKKVDIARRVCQDGALLWVRAYPFVTILGCIHIAVSRMKGLEI
jgi:hypothetical protein